MRSAFTSTVRSIVLLALAPLPVLHCGGGTESSDAGNTSGGTSSGSGSGNGSSSGSSGTTTTSSSGGTSGTSSGSTSGSTSGTTSSGTSSGGPLGDAGVCAPIWLQGGPAQGGEIEYPCGLPQGTDSTCTPYCGSALFLCQVLSNNGVNATTYELPWLDTDAGANPVVVGCYVNHTGRRPAGLVAETGAARSAGELLAEAAYLEAAAVDAFRDLAHQVEALGAPASLVARLRGAAEEEVRHARIVRALARARGCEPREVRVEPTGPRSLLSIALENAREGCVRETWGAACAVAQGERAADLDVREAMHTIARDELGHAALSWDLAAWLETKLTREERFAVAVEQERAVDELEAELEATLPAAWRRDLGFPSREEARAIFGAMRDRVWSVREAA